MHTVLDFSDAEEAARWRVVNDDVMGGCSISELSQTARATGRFSGNTSLENNGGFASTRRALTPGSLAGHSYLSLRVRTDGRAYDLRLWMTGTPDGVSYRLPLRTAPERWQTVVLDLAAAVPTYRGRRVDAPALDASAINRVGLMIADAKAGEFALELQWIRAADSPTAS